MTIIGYHTSRSWSFASSFNWLSNFFCLIRSSVTIASLRALISDCILLHEWRWINVDEACLLTEWLWISIFNLTFPFKWRRFFLAWGKKKKTVNKEFATFCLNCQIKNLTLSQEIWKLRCRLCRHCTHANIFDLLLHKIENYKYLLIHNIFRKTRTVSLANHQLQLNKNSYNDSYSTDKKG